MSNLKDNLVKIREKLDSDNTQPSGGGVLEEVKKIRQILDTDNTYPGGGGLAEEVTAIRELVEDGKGGGGSSLKSISITNELSYSISVTNYLDENGKFVYPSSGADYLRIEVGGTTTVYYPEPAEGSFWLIELGSPNISIQDEVTGVELDGNELLIYPSAENDVSISIISSGIQ